MALFLNEQEVVQLLPMDECIQALEGAFAHAGAGKVDNKARSRIRMPGGFFHFMAAADAGQGCSATRLTRHLSGRVVPR